MNLRSLQARLITNRIVPTANKLGYKLYTDRPNIVAIRNNIKSNNTFNDSLFVFWLDKDMRLTRYHRYIITTEPGLPWLLKPMNKRGAAILKPGQYIDTYALGFHGRGSFRHEALIQIKPVQVYRDNNRDETHDFVGSDTGLFGLNIHRASAWFDITETINKFSAGCQVFQGKSEFEEFITICKKSGLERFTYTLINEKDLIK